jgi:hypothetical protein
MLQVMSEMGLGAISYLLWVDVFNMLQLFILILALIETVTPCTHMPSMTSSITNS